MKKAIGIFEVKGMVSATLWLDAMLKSADVRLIRSEKLIGSGLVTTIIAGEVGAISHALEVAKGIAAQLSKQSVSVVLSNPHEEILKFI